MPSMSARWKAIAARLASRTDDELVALLRELFDLTEANRLLLEARLKTESDGTQALLHARRAALAASGSGAEVRRIVRSYLRVNADPSGAARVLAEVLLQEFRRDSTMRDGTLPRGFKSLAGELVRLVAAARGVRSGGLDTALVELTARVDAVDADAGQWLRDGLAGRQPE